MRNQTKMMAILSTAALISALAPNLPNFAGAVNNAYASTIGWVEEDGELKFYEDETYYVTDSWKKKGNDWLYLDEDGVVAKSTKVDEYYVNEDGKRVTNTWVSEDNEDSYGSDEEPETFWYYYGKDGKTVQSKWQNLGGRQYYFDSEGKMVSGKTEIGSATYYFGDENDGSMKKGWVQLEASSQDPDDEMIWYYFDQNGKMIENQVDKKINGNYYTFVNGEMQTGWYLMPVAGSPSDATKGDSVAGYQYYDLESGKRAKGWYEVEGVEGVSEEDELFKFYFKNGKPHYAETGLQLFTVESRKFAFNTRGEMQKEIKEISVDGGTTANYYFGTDGIMRTGKQTVFNEELGENQTWYFHTEGTRKGQGLHGIKDNTLYLNGIRQSADADLRIEAVALDGTDYLVNTVGVLQKASPSSKSSVKPELGNGFKDYKDQNGVIWTVNVSGVVQK